MNILVYSSILVKNSPASGDAVDVSSLGWEDPLEKGMGSQATVHGVSESQKLSSHTHTRILKETAPERQL